MSLVDAFTACAVANPDASALEWNHARWSYGELARARSGMSAALRGAGLARGDRVALLLRNSP